MQEHIWKECGCLDSLVQLPFYNQSLMCGYNGNAEALIFPEEYNVSHCLQMENMESLPECENLLQKTFNDILCVENVRKEQRHKLGDCDCPPACKSYLFDTFYSLTTWPSEGIHLDSAYKQVVQDNVIPFFNKSEYPVAKDLVKYFADESNKKEILSNFLKLTVYIRDLSVEELEDVASYGPVDLVSDIGKGLFLLLHFAVNTMLANGNCFFFIFFNRISCL